MGFLSTLITHKWAVIKFLIISFIYLYVFARLLLPHFIKRLREDWHKIRYKPWAAPFAGFLKAEHSAIDLIEDAIKALMKMFWVYAKMFFKLLTKPFQYIIKLIHKVLHWLKSIMNKIRQQLMVIRKLLLSIVTAVMERLQNLAGSFINIFFRLRDMLKRGLATYKMIMYTLETATFTFKSIMNGPIGTMAHLAADLGYMFTFFMVGPLSFAMFPSLWHCLFCFHPDTQILKTSVKSVPIQYVSLGESLHGDDYNLVSGILVFRHSKHQKFYTLGKDLVTGSHPVQKTNGDWVYTSNHPQSRIDLTSQSKYTINLCTTANRIHTRSAKYLDWDELLNPDELRYQKSEILRNLNQWTFSYSLDHLYQEGFGIEYLQDIVPNTSLMNLGRYNGSELIQYLDQRSTMNLEGLGIWESTEDVIWYCLCDNYKGNTSNHYVTGSTIVYEPEYELWVPVYASPSYVQVSPETKTPQYIVHLVTQRGTVEIGNRIYRDLMETKHTSTHAMFSSRNLKILNDLKNNM